MRKIWTDKQTRFMFYKYRYSKHWNKNHNLYFSSDMLSWKSNIEKKCIKSLAHQQIHKFVRVFTSCKVLDVSRQCIVGVVAASNSWLTLHKPHVWPLMGNVQNQNRKCDLTKCLLANLIITTYRMTIQKSHASTKVKHRGHTQVEVTCKCKGHTQRSHSSSL